jgi:ion channel POLLUX/CASTOR
LKPAADYIRLDQPVNFYTLLEAARLRGEVALGYRLLGQAQEADQDFGVHLNPKKSERITLTQQDKLIVLAEKE